MDALLTRNGRSSKTFPWKSVTQREKSKNSDARDEEARAPSKHERRRQGARSQRMYRRSVHAGQIATHRQEQCEASGFV